MNGRRSPARRLARLPLMGLGVLALLGALWGGLLRLGWSLPAPPASFAALHGPLMVSGFLGTVIGLERAVALGRAAGYAVPLASGLGGLALLLGLPGPAGPFLMTAASAGLVLIFVVLLGRQPTLFTLVMAAGAGAWLAGQLLWVGGWPLSRVVLWWAAFPVLTIAGERLELSRLVRVSGAGRMLFLLAAGLVLVGAALATAALDPGLRLFGLGLLALALWLGCNDVARRTARQPGVTRFIALSLLAGYVWLGASGALALGGDPGAAGGRYDALLHALFVGFVFSMIFGHAPIIFPAVLGGRVAFRPVFHVHLVLLHLGLALRVAGDLAAWPPGRRWGGLLNALAILLFFASTGYAILRPVSAPDVSRSIDPSPAR